MTDHLIITRYLTVLSNGWTLIMEVLKVERRAEDLVKTMKSILTSHPKSQFTTKMTIESAEKE